MKSPNRRLFHFHCEFDEHSGSVVEVVAPIENTQDPSAKMVLVHTLADQMPLEVYVTELSPCY